MLEDDELNLSDYLDDPTDPVLCVPEQDHDHYWRLLSSSDESALGGPGSTMNFWQLSAHSERLTLGVKMHSAAAFLSMPNSDGVVLGGNSDEGFNGNTVRGYPLRLTLTTMKRFRGDSPDMCSKVPDGVPDAKVIDPIKENYPACTMLLSATTPLHVTPEILCNKQYAQEYVEHVALIRELLVYNSTLLMRSSNQLLRSLGGLLNGTSDCELTREPLPTWNLVKVVRSKSDAEMVRQTVALLGSDENISINLHSAPMPMPEGDATILMHPALVTHLAESKPYYMKGGLIPHLTKKGHFWRSTPPAIHLAMLKYRLHIDPVPSAHQIGRAD